jgi:FkbM family methyltransferase
MPAFVARQLIKNSGTTAFRGKGRLVNYWLAHRPVGTGARVLPGGATMACEFSIDYDCMVYLGQEEEAELRTLLRILRPGDRFIDCGANIGLWSLVAASRLCGSGGHVIAIEPNPATADRLAANIGKNNFAHCVEVVSAAVGGRTGCGRLSLGTSHNVCLINPGAETNYVDVDVLALDGIIRGRTVAGIKLDIEAANWTRCRGRWSRSQHRGRGCAWSSIRCCRDWTFWGSGPLTACSAAWDIAPRFSPMRREAAGNSP